LAAAAASNLLPFQSGCVDGMDGYFRRLDSDMGKRDRGRRPARIAALCVVRVVLSVRLNRPAASTADLLLAGVLESSSGRPKSKSPIS